MTSTSSEFSLEVLLFGVLKDLVHSQSVSVIAPDERSTISVTEMLQLLAAQYPALEQYLPHLRVAVNLEYVNSTHLVQRGDEIALLPPVAGGCTAL